MHGYVFYFEIFNTANINRHHSVAFGICTFPVRVDAAGGTEAVLDNVLIEGISACRVFGGEQGEIVPWRKP